MNKILLILILPSIVFADDLTDALQRSLTPENVMKNIQRDMRTKAQWQRALGNNTGADINQALADSLGHESQETPKESHEQKIERLELEIADMKRQIAELKTFCVKSAQIIRELRNDRLQGN